LPPNLDPQKLSPTELRKLPPEVREAILAQQAERAATLYRSTPELTDFEAFGENDLHIDSSSTEAR
jgi:hypothetical protein